MSATKYTEDVALWNVIVKDRYTDEVTQVKPVLGTWLQAATIAGTFSATGLYVCAILPASEEK